MPSSSIYRYSKGATTFPAAMFVVAICLGPWFPFAVLLPPWGGHGSGSHPRSGFWSGLALGFQGSGGACGIFSGPLQGLQGLAPSAILLLWVPRGGHILSSRHLGCSLLSQPRMPVPGSAPSLGWFWVQLPPWVLVQIPVWVSPGVSGLGRGLGHLFGATLGTLRSGSRHHLASLGAQRGLTSFPAIILVVVLSAQVASLQS